MIENDITYKIRAAAFRVHNELGPGLLESVYEAIEIKSVEPLNQVHFKQLLTYLRLSNKKLGLLINFNVNRLEDKVSIVRIINSFSK